MRHRVVAMVGLAGFILFPMAHAASTTYYVGGTGASDGGAGSQTAPFATIQACANVAMPGDTCLINSGIYHETVTPPRSGTAAAPITFQAAPNAQVTVDGANVVTGWTSYQGNIYMAPATLPFATTTYGADNQVFLDGQMMNEARWPATGPDLLHPTEAIAGSGSGCVSSSTDGHTCTVKNTSLPAGNWVGGVLHIRGVEGWASNAGIITAYTPGVSVTYPDETNPGYYGPNPGASPFYITGGPLSSLASAGQWWYDSTNHLLYLWTPTGDSPSNHTVEAKQRLYGFDLSGQSYINVVGMGLFGTAVMTSPTSTYDVFDRLHALYVAHYEYFGNLTPTATSPNLNAPTLPFCGLNVPGECGNDSANHTGMILDGTNNVIQNSSIRYSAGNGISLVGNNVSSINNLVSDADYLGTYSSGVAPQGSNQTISHNTIYELGRSAVHGPTSTIVSYNEVFNFGILNHDLGAIYACCLGVLGTGGSIDHNLVHDNKTSKTGGSYGGGGVYIDNSASNFLIHHNIIWNLAANGALADPSIFANSNGTYSNNQLVYNNTNGLNDTEAIDIGSPSTGSKIINNLAFNGISAPSSIMQAANVTAGSPTSFFVAPESNDYHLLADSTAVSGGQLIPDITNGPYQGAYGYGVDDWYGGCSIGGCFQNIVLNGGFEDGPLTGGWCSATDSCVGATITMATSHSGESALVLAGAGAMAEQTVTGLAPDTYYFLTAWAETDTSNTTAQIGVMNTGTAAAMQTVNAQTFTPYAVSFKTGPTSTSAQVFFSKSASTGGAYSDDYYLTANLLLNPDFETGKLDGGWCNDTTACTGVTVAQGTSVCTSRNDPQGPVQKDRGLLQNIVYAFLLLPLGVLTGRRYRGRLLLVLLLMGTTMSLMGTIGCGKSGGGSGGGVNPPPPPPPPVCSTSQGDVYDGAYSAFLQGSSARLEQVVHNLRPGTTYTLIAYGKVKDTGDSMSIGVTGFGAADVQQTVSGTSFAPASVVFTTGIYNTSAKIFVSKQAGTGAGVVDDFLLVQSPPTI